MLFRSTQLTIDDQQINLATLPLNPAPPICFSRKLYVGSLAPPMLNGSSIYRTSRAIYLVGLTPNSLNTVNYSKAETKTLTLNNPSCGLFRMQLKSGLTMVRIDGVEMTIPTDMSDFDCQYKTQLPPANTLIRDRDLGRYYVYRTSDLNKKTLTVTTEIAGSVSKKIPVNKCGFAVISIVNVGKGSQYGGKVSINGSAMYSIDSLPLANSDIKCLGNVTYKSAVFGVSTGVATDIVPPSVIGDAPPPPPPPEPEEPEEPQGA